MAGLHHLIACLVIGVGVIACVDAQCRCDTAQNRALLQDLYVSTQGPLWTNNTGWLLPDTPICNWYGVTCVGSVVDSIALSNNNLNGTLPKSLGELKNMTSLEVSNNEVNGPLPASWSSLTKLQNLDVSNNKLTGPLPDEWAALTALQWIDVSRNRLAGTLPGQWSAWTALMTLDVSNNQLTGSLPDEWRAFRALNYLLLGSNQLTGMLPEAWGWGGLTTTVQSLAVDNNQLTGTIPSSWGNFKAAQYLDLNNNHLTGCFDMCQFHNTQAFYLNLLDVTFNNLSGAFNLACLSIPFHSISGATRSSASALLTLETLEREKIGDYFDVMRNVVNHFR